MYTANPTHALIAHPPVNPSSFASPFAASRISAEDTAAARFYVLARPQGSAAPRFRVDIALETRALLPPLATVTVGLARKGGEGRGRWRRRVSRAEVTKQSRSWRMGAHGTSHGQGQL